MSTSILSPKSIAVVGASDKKGSVGRAITNNIIKGYKGPIYPISPSRPKVFGIKAYKSVLDVPKKIDLAVIVTKNTIVPYVLEECGKKGVKGVIIITAGFKEVDKEGAKLELKLNEIAKKYNISLVGPNCLGVMNLDPKTMMNSTFLKITPKSGEIALISQSGAICAALVEDASAQGIGFSAVISMGNKAQMSEVDMLHILAKHKQTKVIVMYLEDMGDGQEFLKICRHLTRDLKKPVLVLKSGRSPEGAKAAMSHTGALMGSDEYGAVAPTRLMLYFFAISFNFNSSFAPSLSTSLNPAVIMMTPFTPFLPHSSSTYGTMVFFVTMTARSIFFGTSRTDLYAFMPKTFGRLGLIGYIGPLYPLMMLFVIARPTLPFLSDAPTTAIDFGERIDVDTTSSLHL